MIFLLVTFFTINHFSAFTSSFSSSFTSFPSPLCSRLEAFSQSQLQTSLDLKMFSLYERTLYLIDEEDDLYELSISEQTANLLHSSEELPLFITSETDHAGKLERVTRWAQPVGKWYNHPWLRLDAVNSPLARLQLYGDHTGRTLWRQYLFADGRHCLVNNRTGQMVVAKGDTKEFRDYLVINSELGGLLFHYDSYSWLRSSKLSSQNRRVVFRLSQQRRFSKGQKLYMITNAHRSALYLRNSKPISTGNDLFLKLPIGGFFVDYGKKLFLLTGKFTREVIVVENFTTVHSEQKWQAVRTKSWSSFFRCWPNTSTSSKGLDQSNYLKVASMVIDDREVPGTFWAKVAAYIIASTIVLTGCFFVYPRGAASRKAGNEANSNSGSNSSSGSGDNFGLTSSPLDRKSKLRLSDLKLNNKRSSRSSSSSSSSNNNHSSSSSSIASTSAALSSSTPTQVGDTPLWKLPPKELTTIRPLDCSSLESINRAINQQA